VTRVVRDEFVSISGCPPAVNRAARVDVDRMRSGAHISCPEILRDAARRLRVTFRHLLRT
jgi:hypothetical protein